MRRNRRILFSTCKLLASIFLTASIASASVTKVGNGDDGSDLEALSFNTYKNWVGEFSTGILVPT